jgi:hypothetical protein
MNEIIIHEIFSNLTPLVFGVTIVISLAWVITHIVKALKQRANLQTKIEIYSRMIDKFGAAPEFISFLESEEGRRFIDENVTQSNAPMKKILGSIQICTTFTLVGIGLLVLGNIFDNSLGGDLYIVLTVSGTVALMVGIGLLISVLISYKLSKSWGLLAVKEKAKTEKE